MCDSSSDEECEWLGGSEGECEGDSSERNTLNCPTEPASLNAVCLCKCPWCGPCWSAFHNCSRGFV